MAGVKQPADKSYFILPDLGEGVAEAELLEWKVSPGDRVEEHQTLAEMETDKARVEVPSPWSGVIKDLGGEPGDIMKVGATLVTYDIGAAAAPTQQAESAAPASAGGGATPELTQPEQREDTGTVVGTVGGAINVSERFTRRRADPNGERRTAKALATPAVRRIARELGVDINRVDGSGRGGRVTASDVEDCAREETTIPTVRVPAAGSDRFDAVRVPAATAPAATEVTPPSKPIEYPAPVVSSDGVSQRIPIRGIRRTIAQALHRSMSTAVHFTVVDEADVTELDRKRRELIFATGEKISLLPFILTAVCKALKEHPMLNANVDDAKEEILLKNVINLGIAVDTEQGLMVPVLSNADRSSIFELNRRVKDVAARCQSRTIPREELIGGTFTISNVGSGGGMFTTPIINYPEVAILASGRAREQVVPRHGGFHLGTVLPLSLSCDHRVVDGAVGTRFLTEVMKLLEDPQRLLQP